MSQPTILGPQAITLPTDTTGNRPAGSAGFLRYNTTTKLPEVYDGNGWQSISVQPTVTSISGGITYNTSTTLTVNGQSFMDGCYVQIEGAGVGTNARSLITTYVNSTQVTANTAGATTNYTQGSSFNVRVVNPGGLSYVLSSAGTVS